MSVAAPARRLELRVHGVGVRLASDSPRLLGGLARDFSAFVGGPAGPPPDVDLAAFLAPSPLPPLRAAVPWRGCRFADAGGLRRVEYAGGAAAAWDLARGRGRLWSADADLLHELAWLHVHSRVGALLDARGLHRVHALGFSWRGRGGLVLLPSGGGKTALALAMAGRPEFSLLSDDIPVLGRDGVLRAFPQRLSLRDPAPEGIPAGALRPFRRRRHGDKVLLDAAAYPGRWAESAPLRWLVVARRPAAAALASALVVGAGTPQVLELVMPLSAAAAADAARAAASRARAAARALAAARVLALPRAGGPAAAAAALAARLDA